MFSREQILERQIPACLQYLKLAVGNLHNAKLAMEAIDKTAAEAMERMLQEIRSHIKLCQELSQGQK